MDSLTLNPIGIIRTPFTHRADAPRQPRAEARIFPGEIILNAGHNYEQALEDLSGFDYIWIVCWFHLNDNWKTKVRPPQGSKIKRGVFATRSPYRPNPIGLSLARLVSVEGRTIHIAETDLLDGTPVLDIKPYLPYAEAHPDARSGWMEAHLAAENPDLKFTWSDYARKQAAWLLENFDVDLAVQAERTLAFGTAPHPYRRIKKLNDSTMELAIKTWRVEFKATEDGAEILRIRSGYSSETLDSSDDPNYDAPHRAFLAHGYPGS